MNSSFPEVQKNKIEIIQINICNKCNLSCTHCHVNASPKGEHMMSKQVMEQILEATDRYQFSEFDITGGSPETNPNFEFLLRELYRRNISITVRTNLCILDEPEYNRFIDIYKELSVNLVASLPCYLQENVDKQRGNGVFEKNIKVLKKLNSLGFGSDALSLNLVYNPVSASLPPSQDALETDYKKHLLEEYGIAFNRLLTITNVPINGFKKFLEANNQLDYYMSLLKDNYNSNSLDGLMCKRIVSVDYFGYVYDCDFNQMLNMKTAKEQKFWEIDFSKFSFPVKVDDHCYSCTAGAGSSCYGALE